MSERAARSTGLGISKSSLHVTYLLAALQRKHSTGPSTHEMLHACCPNERTNQDKWLQLKSVIMEALIGKGLSAETRFCAVIPGSRTCLLVRSSITPGTRKLSSEVKVPALMELKGYRKATQGRWPRARPQGRGGGLIEEKNQ